VQTLLVKKRIKNTFTPRMLPRKQCAVLESLTDQTQVPVPALPISAGHSFSRFLKLRISGGNAPVLSIKFVENGSIWGLAVQRHLPTLVSFDAQRLHFKANSGYGTHAERG
jgi:hypothetical protein